MDELVRQALARWPDVPAIAGWLRLTARGEWLLTGEVATGLRIAHPNMRRFIDRNYATDESGRWFFQNGPQKVYVSLEYTPWVFSIHPLPDGHYCLLSHNRQVALPEAVLLDEDGMFLFQTHLGIGVMRDTDMEMLSAFLAETPDGWSLAVPWGLPDELLCARNDWSLSPHAVIPCDASLTVHSVMRADVPVRFCFNPQPVV